MFLLVPAYPGCPGSKAVKRSLLLLLLLEAITAAAALKNNTGAAWSKYFKIRIP